MIALKLFFTQDNR